MTIRALRILFAGVFLVMLWVTTWASSDRSVLVAFGQLWQDPWGRATLFDAYFGFLTFYVWLAYKERGPIRRLVWFVAVMGLGNFAIAGYLLWQLWRLPPSAPIEDLLLERPFSTKRLLVFLHRYLDI